MAPAIIQVNSTDPNNVIKTMLWPIQYALPNAPQLPLPTLPDDAIANSDTVFIVTVPESVVAVRTFNDMIVEPLVRKVDVTLRQYLQHDGLLFPESVEATTATKLLTFAQYDAIYSMGERRCEVHIVLPDGTHPWC